jgi:hypothetical protein
MVPLVAQLNASGDTTKVDVDINAQVQHWIFYILDHQLPSGWLGPDDGFGEWWCHRHHRALWILASFSVGVGRGVVSGEVVGEEGSG